MFYEDLMVKKYDLNHNLFVSQVDGNGVPAPMEKGPSPPLALKGRAGGRAGKLRAASRGENIQSKNDNIPPAQKKIQQLLREMEEEEKRNQ